MDPIRISRSPDRYVCNTSECSTTKVYFSNARPPGNSVQCPIIRFKSMGTDLSFSTSEPLAQSTDETKGVQRNGNTDSPRIAELEEFSPLQFHEQEDISPRLFSLPNQFKSIILCEVLSNKIPSRIDILRNL